MKYSKVKKCPKCGETKEISLPTFLLMKDDKEKEEKYICEDCKIKFNITNLI